MYRLFLVFFLLCSVRISANISKIIKEIEQSGKISISLKSLKGEVLFAHNTKEKLIPASNLKLISSAAILDEFGLNHTFGTNFYWNGKELIIKGSGDPAISDRFYEKEFHIFESLLKVLKSHNITKIEKLSGDNSLFSGITTPPDWETADKVYYYAPELSPLSYNDNCIDLTTNSKAVEWFPFNTDYAKIINKLKYGTDYKEKIIKDKNTFTLCSEIPKGIQKKEYLAVSKPAFYTLHVLKEFLEENGITCEEIDVYEKEVDYKGFIKLFTHQSPKMEKLLKIVLHNSNNFFTEMLTWSASAQKYETKGSYHNSLKLINDFLVKEGFERQTVTDSCGLSRTNRLSTDFITEFLITMSGNEQFNKLLATSKDRKSLKFLKKEFEHRIKAKTGSMSGIYALSGFIDDKFTFSIIINNSSERRPKLQKQIVAILKGLVSRHVSDNTVGN